MDGKDGKRSLNICWRMPVRGSAINEKQVAF
jgi:hypothetical protein